MEAKAESPTSNGVAAPSAPSHAASRVQRWNWLKRWGVEVARRRGQMRARMAVARRLAVVMHRIWADGTTFCWARDQAAGTAA